MMNDISLPPDEEITKRIRAMKDEELVDFVRDTVARLNALADRLELYADEAGEGARHRA